MKWYKVILGSRRYTTERIVRVCAESTVDACSKAISAHKGMRYAIAREER